MADIHSLDESIGLLRRGTIVKYLPDSGILRVRLNTAPAVKGNKSLPIDIPAPHALFYNNGLFIGTLPVEGTPVIVGQGSGGQYYFVSFLAENLPLVPDLSLGTLLIRSNDDTKISLDVKNNINIGSDVNKIHIDTNANLITTNFHNENHFTQAQRYINGVIKRDLIFNTQYDQDNKLESDDYNTKFKIIGMDPTTTPNDVISGSTKNPPLVESREITYEFQYQSNIEDDLKEANRYNTSTPSLTSTSAFTFPNRRLSRADTLSLSLVSPNYLMEEIKGTVVDIFGNLLDINRYPLPIGQDQNTINNEKSTDKQASFLLIKELERKSLAYHFELNARKDLIGPNNTSPTLPDINSNADYSRNRSRFFFDIDKEGQFKLNVPASSEKGNISLLSRYENYSTFGSDDNGNPNKLVYRTDNIDIYQDSFASPALTPSDGGFLPAEDQSRGSIKLVSSNSANSAPIDRITKQHIKHGMVYHDIMQTCFIHQNNAFLNYQGGEVDPLTVDLANIPELTQIANDTIITSGATANAGGRSGSMNFDGSMEFNFGANTIDRQSLWIDTAGGAVINLGRDIRGRSLMAAAGGDFFLQVGGFGVLGDSRFTTQDNGIKGAVMDLRIMTNGGYCHMIRCDDNGITIMTPGNLAVHSKGDMTLTSDKDIRIECNTLTLQERMHLKTFGGSS